MPDTLHPISREHLVSKGYAKLTSSYSQYLSNGAPYTVYVYKALKSLWGTASISSTSTSGGYNDAHPSETHTSTLTTYVAYPKGATFTARGSSTFYPAM